MKNSENSTLVYSSESGRIKQDKQKNRLASPQRQPSDGVVRLQRETKGRCGGTVIVVTGIPLDAAGLKVLAAELKKRCGCGGSVKGSSIEIQGDHRDILMLELQSRGYRVKAAGG